MSGHFDTMGAMDVREDTTDDLKEYLDAVARSDGYAPVRKLSAGEGEVTELVRFKGEGGCSLGPFVRKVIDVEHATGSVYEDLYRAQRAGRRFVHIPRVLECFKTGRSLVVVSEYIEGDTLDALVARRLSYAAPDHIDRAGYDVAREVFPQICDAVIELHESFDPPVIHRDLKPQNVVIAHAGVFLIDFGIARRYRADAARDTVRLGTRAYAPPEQYGFGQTGVASDVFALGGMLAFCLTGTEPAGGAGSLTLPPYLDARLATVVRTAMAFDPDARFPSVRELKQAFLDVAGVTPGEDDECSALPRTPDAPGATDLPPAPAPPPRRARTDRGALVQNVAIGLVALLFLAACAQDIASPGEALTGKPPWYIVALDAGIVLPTIWGCLYCALDKRILYRHVPRLAGRTWRSDLIALGSYLAIAFLLLLVASVATGLS